MSKTGVTSYLGIAHPWFCDVMGHMNVRHYMAMFDDAAFHLLGLIGGEDVARDGNSGWADVRIEVDLTRETLAGDLLTVRSWVTRIGRSSLTTEHELIGTLDRETRARAIVTTVYFDLAARKSIEIPDNIRSRAQSYSSETEEEL